MTRIMSCPGVAIRISDVATNSHQEISCMIAPVCIARAVARDGIRAGRHLLRSGLRHGLRILAPRAADAVDAAAFHERARAARGSRVAAPRRCRDLPVTGSRAAEGTGEGDRPMEPVPAGSARGRTRNGALESRL